MKCKKASGLNRWHAICTSTHIRNPNHRRCTVTEARVLSLVEKGLFLKFGVLTTLVLALALAAPARQLLRASAHQVCQAGGMPAAECSTS